MRILKFVLKLLLFLFFFAAFLCELPTMLFDSLKQAVRENSYSDTRFACRLNKLMRLEIDRPLNKIHTDGSPYLIHLACQNNYAESLRALLKAGGEPNRLSPLGWLPLDIAVRENHDEICLLLLQYGAESDWALNRAISNKNVPIIKLLLSRPGFVVCSKDGQGLRSIDYANQSGSKEIAELVGKAHKDACRE